MSAPAQLPPERGSVPGSRWSDHEVEQVVGRLLQVGVLLATAVVLVGAVMVLFVHGGSVADFRVFQGEASPFRSVGAILQLVASGDARAIVQLGLVLLIATPIARVLFTLGAFILQRDRLYVALTALVLAVLLFGLF